MVQLVDKARDYLGLKALESATPEGGILTVHIGDALSSEATVEGGFAGISPFPSCVCNPNYHVNLSNVYSVVAWIPNPSVCPIYMLELSFKSPLRTCNSTGIGSLETHQCILFWSITMRIIYQSIGVIIETSQTESPFPQALWWICFRRGRFCPNFKRFVQ